MASLEKEICESTESELVYASEVVRIDPYASSKISMSAEDGWVAQITTAGADPYALLARKSYQCIRPFNCYGPQFHFTEGRAPPYVYARWFIRFLSWAPVYPKSNTSYILVRIRAQNAHAFESPLGLI